MLYNKLLRPFRVNRFFLYTVYTDIYFGDVSSLDNRKWLFGVGRQFKVIIYLIPRWYNAEMIQNSWRSSVHLFAESSIPTHHFVYVV